MASSRELLELDEAELRLRKKLDDGLQEIEEKRKAVQQERVNGLGHLLVRANVLTIDDTVICGALLALANTVRRAEAGDPESSKTVESWKRDGARFLPEQKAKRGRQEGVGKAPTSRKKAGKASATTEPADVATKPAEGSGVGAGPAGTNPNAHQLSGPGDRSESA